MPRLLPFSLLLFVSVLPSWPAAAQSNFDDCASNTGNNATLVIPEEARLTVNAQPLAPGSELAVRTADGLCAGVVVWVGKPTALTLWGDDPMTAHVDGLAEGEALHFVVWDAASRAEHAGPGVTYVAGAYYADDGRYHSNAIAVLDALAVTAPPVGPEPSAPTTGTDYVSTAPELAWHAVAGAEAYQVQVATTDDFGALVIDETVHATALGVSGLAYETTYYWRVRAHGEAGAGAWSETVWFTTGPVSTSGAQGPDLPQQTALHPNYPNPFERVTTIPFDVAETAAVTLAVYDVLGRRVAVLLDGVVPAGRHAVRWEAGALPAGVYFGRLQAGGASHTHRLIVGR